MDIFIKKATQTLRAKMLILLLLFWLLPTAFVLINMSYYIYSSYNYRVSEEIAGGLDTGLQITSDRLDSAVSAIRRPGYDGIIRSAWNVYQDGDVSWISLHYNTTKYLGSQYRGDERFPIVAFWFSEAPEEMQVGLYNEGGGGGFQRLSDFWETDFYEILEYSKGIDTYAGFYQKDGRLYIVKNLVDNRFNVIGTQAIELDTSVFFDGISQVAWGSSLCVWINDCQFIIRGDEPKLHDLGIELFSDSRIQGKADDGSSYCFDTEAGDGYSLSALVQIDKRQLLSQIQGYQSLLIMMALLIGPMLFIYYKLYQRNITKPMLSLMEGAEKIEEGDFGYQIEEKPKSVEFGYIVDSFNHMSGQLQSQFDHIYREELSLRDAKIKALQSQINPHFLNNTLEIINWEARIGGNAKVSKMIEALSTLLDAAMDRSSSQQVRLSEEMHYINAYLFIADQRFGKRLHVTQDIDPDTLDYMVPRLILQPVVENAVEHGILPGGMGEVSLVSRLEGEKLIFEVTNDGELTKDDVERIERLLSPDFEPISESSYNLGIANVNQRLKILYGEGSGLSIELAPGKGVVARIEIDSKKEGIP